MTLREAEDIANECRQRAAWKPPVAGRELLLQAAEAIEYLLVELEAAERGLLEWLTMEVEP